jgi:CubicO group peptidase (beta-lactamase class C family)
MPKKNFSRFTRRFVVIICLLATIRCSGDTSVTVDPLPVRPPDPEVPTVLPEDVEGQPSKEYLTGRIHQLCTYRNVPLIQLAHKTPKRFFAIETAQLGLETASQDQTTIFQAASISKVVFSYVVLRLVDRGMLDLDKPLYFYTGGEIEDRFKNAYPDDELSARNEEWGKRLTARIVLTHGTGLPNWMSGGSQNTSKLVFTYAPDTRYTYSGEGIHYLQRVVEHITGTNLDQIAQQEVFIPLGMTNTSFKWQDEYQTTAAHGYNAANVKGSQGTKVENAAYSLRTNVHDFSKFLNALMVGNGLKRETFRQMTSPLRMIEHGRYFGLGVRVDTNLDTGFGPLWYHSGSNTNFRCIFWMLPQKGTYSIFFTNSENGAGDTRTGIAEILFPEYTGVKF